MITINPITTLIYKGNFFLKNTKKDKTTNTMSESKK